ncbi:hypothetical protein EON65_34140 [archaeon]|nr:MAG: hypothetical protein EON65_34140 [archaeon]
MAKDKRKRIEESSSEEEKSVSSESGSDSDSSSTSSSSTSSEEEPKRKLQKTAPARNEQKPKALPPGYRCNACGAVDDHAIYNCPNKIAKNEKPKENPEKKTSSSSTIPSDPSTPNTSVADKKKEKKERKKDKSKYEKRVYKRSVFVSGLPFTSTKDSILKLLNDNMEGEFSLKPRDVVLLTFPDNPQRCKGLAYVNFADEDEFSRALAVDGIKVENKTLNVVESKIATKSSTGEKKKYNKVKRCFRCGKTGHEPKECTNPRVCYKCLATDHISKDCPKKQKTA